MKKYLLISLIAVVAGGLFVAGYFLRRGDDDAVPPPPQENGGGFGGFETPDGNGGVEGGLGGVIQKLTSFSSVPVVNYFLESSASALLIQTDGQILRLQNNDGEVLSASPLANLIKADFSHDGEKILVEFGSSLEPQFSVFDVSDKSWRPLPAEVREAAWSPSDYRVVYLAQRSGGLSLGFVDMKNSNPTLKDAQVLNAFGVELHWIKDGEVFVKEKSSTGTQTRLWKFSIAGRTLKEEVESDSYFETNWSASGEKRLDFLTGKLTLRDNQEDSSKTISFKTLPSKCGFGDERGVEQGETSNTQGALANQEILVCAVPKDSRIWESTGMPDDYSKRGVFTLDNIYKIRLDDGAVSKILEGENIDAENLKLLGRKVFFVNRYDSRIYSVDL